MSVTGIAPVTRQYYRGESAFFTVRNGIYIKGIITFKGSSAPVYVPATGDIPGFSVARSNTGLYTVTTTDSAPFFAGVDIEWLQGTPLSNNILAIGLPVKTTTNTWQVPFSTFAAGSAADPTSGDMADVFIVLRKSSNST